MIARVHDWLRGRRVDRVLANWEPLVMTAARLNERFGLPGHVGRHRARLSRQAADEGPRRGRGAPRADGRSARTRSPTCWKAIETIGYPAIIKPISGAGSADTYKVVDPRPS